MTLHTTLLGGGFGRKSKCDFAIEAALLSKEMGGAPVKVVWTREDDIQHGFYHTVTAERFEAGLDAANKVVAWRHRSAAPSFMANFMPDPKHPQRHRARHGVGRHALQRAQHPHGERRGAEPPAGRLVPLGQQRGACLVDPVLHRRAGSTAGPGPEGLPAGADRPGADRRRGEVGHHAVVGLRRAARDLSRRHRTAAAGGRAGRREGRMGQAAAQRPGARHRRASQLRQLHRHGGARRGRRQGQDHDPAGRHRDRLRLLRAIPSGCARRWRARPSWG